MNKIALLFCVTLLCACKKKEAVSNENSALAAEFSQFYDRFLSDSTYQMQHIQFPLAGVPMDSDSLTAQLGNYYWDAATWKLHKPMNFKDTYFKRTITMPLPNVIQETVQDTMTKYAIMRRFTKTDKEWMLIYFMNMNRLK
jgi:Domain of unknown function (DUF4348)